MIFNKNFMRLFSLYRMMEADAERWGEISDELAVEVRQLRQKSESGAALIESLNRYITALEGKAAAQAELIQELRGHLSGVSLPPQ